MVPLRRDESLAPSSVLVRQALASKAPADAATLRAALAVAMALMERGGEEGARTAAPTSVSELADRTGLPPSEVTEGCSLLRHSGVLSGTADAPRVDPDVCCTLPALAALDWPFCRETIEEAGGGLAPALAVLREAGRLSRMAPDGGGEWLTISIRELAAETLYGRTAVTRALGDLVRIGILHRAEQPSRRGLKIRLDPRALGSRKKIRPGDPRPSHEPTLSRRAPPVGATAGVRVDIGGASLNVPPGSSLRLPEGMDYRLEIGPDGEAVIRIDD